MSTPLVAGAAALVRQYFREGRLMNGMGNELVREGFAPSAALVKACILHSGRALTVPGSSSSRRSLPSLDQGYGGMDLSRALWFGGGGVGDGGGDEEAVGPARLRVVDGVHVADGQVLRFCLSFPAESSTTAAVGGRGGHPLAVTVVWTDPPAQPQADRALVNDIDLRVIGPDNRVLLGNRSRHAYICPRVDTRRVYIQVRGYGRAS